MVEEVGYSSRVRVQPGAALPGVSAESMGAGVAQAIGQTGQLIHEERLQDERLDRQLRDNAEWSAALVEDAKAREELQGLAREGRNSDVPGHAERIGKALQEREERLVGMVTSGRLKEQLRARVAEWGGNLRAREADWEFLRGQEKTVENVEQTLKVLDGEARRAKTPLEYQKVIQSYRDGLGGLNVSDEIKGKLDVEVLRRGAMAFVRGRIDENPQFAREMLDNGSFDGVLSGDEVEVLRNGSEVEIRRRDAERERDQAEALASIRSDIALFKQADRMGLVQDDTAYDTAIAKAQALGDQALVLELTGLKANNAFTKVWGPENATALQREQRIAALAAQDKLGPQDALELQFLRDKSPGWASEEARDPVTQASRRGGQGAPPIIDLADGTTWNARAAWMASRGIDAGFAEVELRELRSAAETPQGELQVMEQLDKVSDPYARSRMAEQIKPDDPTFRQMSMLRPGIRATVRQGRKAMANNPKFFTNVDPAIEAKMGAMDAAITYALREYDDDLKLATRETMRQFIAGNLAAQGYADASTFVPGEGADRTFRSAVAHALGGGYIVRNGQKFLLGGVEDWAGRAYVLPPNINEAEFKRRLTVELQQTRNPPVNPDGSAANLYRATPVAVGDGWYEWETATGAPIKAKNGRNFRVRLGR